MADLDVWQGRASWGWYTTVYAPEGDIEVVAWRPTKKWSMRVALIAWGAMFVAGLELNLATLPDAPRSWWWLGGLAAGLLLTVVGLLFLLT